MSRRAWVPASFIAVLLAFVGCSTVRVSQDYPADADFSNISSYAWAPETKEETGDLRVDSPLMEDRIRNAVEQKLAEKGVLKTDRPGADVLVRYRFKIREKIRSDDVRGGFGFGYGTHGGVGGVMIGTGANVQTYDEGTLAVDLIRPGAGDLIWRGVATFRVPDHPSPEETTGQINEAVGKILAQFPPGPEEK